MGIRVYGVRLRVSHYWRSFDRDLRGVPQSSMFVQGKVHFPSRTPSRTCDLPMYKYRPASNDTLYHLNPKP